jgi:hypothetical protein
MVGISYPGVHYREAARLELRSLQRKPTSVLWLHGARSHSRPAAHGTTVLAVAAGWYTDDRARNELPDGRERRAHNRPVLDLRLADRT